MTSRHVIWSVHGTLSAKIYEHDNVRCDVVAAAVITARHPHSSIITSACSPSDNFALWSVAAVAACVHICAQSLGSFIHVKLPRGIPSKPGKQ